MNPPQRNEGADLEVASEPLRFLADWRITPQLRAQDSGRHEQLGSYLVAPQLDAGRWRACRSRVGQGGCTDPDVRELVGQREHLRRLRIGAVDEHERCPVVGESESAELVRVQLPPVVADDAADHDENASVVGADDEAAESFGPRRRASPFIEVEPQVALDAPRRMIDVGSRRQRADETEGRLVLRARELAVPVLPLLADVDRVEQVGARARDGPVTNSAEVRDWHSLDGWFRQQEKANRSMGGPCEVFELFQRGTVRFVFRVYAIETDRHPAVTLRRQFLPLERVFRSTRKRIRFLRPARTSAPPLTTDQAFACAT